MDQLNDTSTQPGAQITIDTCKQVELDEIHAKITAVEKQLHAALGATHKADVNGGMKMVRVPSVHQISNYVESTRKRVKNIEDMEGTTKCAKFLQFYHPGFFKNLTRMMLRAVYYYYSINIYLHHLFFYITRGL